MRLQMANRWTEEEEALIIKLRDEGLSIKEITLRLPNRTVSAVRVKAAQIAKKSSNWTLEDKKLLVQLKAKGKSANYIAKALNRTANSVNSYYSKHFNELQTIPRE